MTQKKREREARKGRRQRRFKQRLATYSLAGAVAVAASSDSAEGAIRYSGVRDFPVPAFDFTGVYLNPLAGTIHAGSSEAGDRLNLFHTSFSFTTTTTTTTMPVNVTGTVLSFLGFDEKDQALLDADGYAAMLGSGVEVGAGAGAFESAVIMALIDSFGSLYGSWQGATGFLGFSFDNSGVENYGWMRLTTAGDITSENPVAIIHDWAIEDTGAPIKTGAVPEASSLGLLALGAAGVLASRRIRKKSTTKSA